MSIASEIKRIQSAKQDIADAIVAKGGSLGGESIDTFAQAIAELPSGGDTFGDRLRDALVDYKMPDDVTSIPAYGFYSMSNLENLDYGKVESIGNSAFRGCTKLVTIVIPHIKTIDTNAFYANYRAKLYDFGEDLASVGSNGLTYAGGCIVIFRGSTPPTITANALSNNIAEIYVPDDAVDTYKTATNISAYASKIHPLSEYNQ